jgi:hypothetical protein
MSIGSRPSGEGMITMTDLVELTAPLGALGRAFEPLIVRYVRRLIDRRNHEISRVARIPSDPPS